MKAGAYLVGDNMQKGRKGLQYSNKLQWAFFWCPPLTQKTSDGLAPLKSIVNHGAQHPHCGGRVQTVSQTPSFPTCILKYT
jgi:hypothetical protein